MTANEAWPASDEAHWVSWTAKNGRDISTWTAGLAVLPAGTPLTDADVQAPLAIERPTVSTIRAELQVDTDDLPTTVPKFNIWIQVVGDGQKISRVVGQLKRPRF